MKKLVKLLVVLVLTFAMAFAGLPVAMAAGESTLINTATQWRYLDNNTDPAAGLDSLTAWTTADFDDSTWKTAAGKFGSKAGQLANVSGCGTPTVLLNLYKENSTQVIPTYFFRNKFYIENISLLSALEFQISADDAIIVYINGKVVLDSRNFAYDCSDSATTNMYYATSTSPNHSFNLDEQEIAKVVKNGENVIAVELHNNQANSTDIYFSMDSMKAITIDPNAPTFSSVVLNVGANETERNLTWYTAINKTSSVQFAPTSDMIGNEFPTKYETVTAVTTRSSNKGGYYINKATLTNLNENTDYVYRLVLDGKISKNYYFSVGSFGDFEFAFVGDPQFNNNVYRTQWIDTLQKINKNFNAEFVLSAGDQINTPDSEEEYDLFIVDELAATAFAPTIGTSHDTKSDAGKGVAYTEHYNLPNESQIYGVTNAGGDYWYVYNNTLFMNLNIEAKTTADLTTGHKEFMRQAIAANPDVTWKVVVVHASLYSTGMHCSPDYKYFNIEIGLFRERLAPIFTELDIDIVLSGHDHVYVRSHLMNGTQLSGDAVTNSYAVKPQGVQYICANSSTGSKFYDNQVENAEYVAFENYEKRKSAIIFKVTDTEFSMKSYFLDDMSVFDSFTIYNTETAVPAVDEGWKIDANGWWYKTADGYKANEWFFDGVWYYFNGSGYMVTGWQQIGGTWYYFNSSGAMLTGWQSIGSTWYYFNSSGAMVTDWQQIGGTWYYFHSSGAMAIGWVNDGGTWYYFHGSGAMATGWQVIGSYWYYFYGSGAMASNCYIDGCWLNASGAWA